MPNELTYSRLIVVRVTHPDPRKLSVVADLVREELERVFVPWMEAIPAENRPTIETVNLSLSDFPFREVKQ